MTAWRVWRARSADMPALVQLEKLAFGERSWGENNVRESIVAPRVTVLMAGMVDFGEASGFALWRDLGPQSELLAIGVDPARRREGVAQALLSVVMGEAAAAGAEQLFLEVDAANEPALGLYRAAGFEDAGMRKAYYRDGADAVVMKRAL